jgi:hypothetical protein
MAVVQLNTARLGPVAEVRSFLEAVEQAYNELYAFHLVVAEVQEASKAREVAWRFTDRRRTTNLRRIAHSEAVVLPEDRLRLRSIRVQSPGTWDFLGSLNPLETLRKYVQDRHERRKDRQYRERLDADRMELENQRLKTAVVKDQVDLLRSLGVPEDKIRELLTKRVVTPLELLDRFQDSGLLEGATLLPEQEPPRETDS